MRLTRPFLLSVAALGFSDAKMRKLTDQAHTLRGVAGTVMELAK